MFIGITAFLKKDDVIAQLESLYEDSNYYLIHYNYRSFLKQPFSYFSLKRHFRDYKNIKIFTKFKVYWGHFSIIKSANYLMNKFLESNEDIFVHLDQKTICFKSLLEIEKLIKKEFDRGNNFFNFNKSFLDKIEINNEKGHLISRQKNPEFYTSKKFYFRTLKQNSFFYKLNMIILIIMDLLKNPRLINLNLRKTFKQWNEYKIYPIKSNISAFLSSKNYELPQIINDWSFSFYNNVGPFLIIKKDEAIKISDKKNNVNYKKVKAFKKYSKNKYLPEDFYFSTLYWNLINNDLKKSKNILAYYDINNRKDAKYFFDNLWEKDIFFLRRCIGKENINFTKNEYAKRYNNNG